MSSIKILDLFTANQIAAGEVVERPASVVKELCENSLDAGASVITVSAQNGGVVAISVADNGIGMDREDAKNAFARHATSKLSSIADFATIQTMGFRGEALASIAAVSKITLKTRPIGSGEGTIVRIADGNILEHGPAGCPEGSNILVEQLFYNTPARYKFLKKDSTESSYITDIIERFILGRPDVSFRLFQNGQEILHSPGNNDLKSAIFSVYGKSVTQALIPVSFQTEKVSIEGFVGKPEIGRNSRQNQSFFINSRYVKSKTITAAVDEAYKTLLMKGKFAFCVLHLTISPALVDVNVHPQKTEVKFWNDQEIYISVLHALKGALAEGITIPEIFSESGAHAGAVVQNQEPPAAISLQETILPDIPDRQKSPAPNLQAPPSSAPIAPAASVPYHYPLRGENIRESTTAAESFREPETPPYAKQTQEAVQEIPIPEELTVNELANARLIGVLFHTYLLLEVDKNLILIDQHAAHERILFEKLLVRYREKKSLAQPLLTSEFLDFTAHEVGFIQENLELFSKIGFECEIFGPQSIVLRTVPLDIREIDVRAAFRGVLDMLRGAVLTEEDRISKAFYTIACKAAVKANDNLDDLEIAHLIRELQRIPNPTHCPHGRPILLKMSQVEIEKAFKRIVS